MTTITCWRKIRVVTLFCIGLASAQAGAAVQGEITPDSGSKVYNIDVANQNITDNSAGATIPYEFSLGGQYYGTAVCTVNISGEAIYFTSTASLLQSGNTAGYLKLNDYMDVKIELYIAKNGEARYLSVPFTNVSNNTNQNSCLSSPGYVRLPVFESGSRGKVTFMLTKPIINGVTLQGTEIARLYGRLGNLSTAMGSTPMAIIYINSGVLTVPDKCIVNSGTPITVEFNTIPGTGSMLNGIKYSQPVPIQVKCEGGSFANGTLNIRLGIQQANTATFNSDYLGTTGSVDRSNLGIALKDSGGSLVVPNRFYDVPGFANNQGTWNLTAAPIANSGTNIPEGEFQASATLVAEFQ